MHSIDDIDLREVERDRLRNQADRYRFLDFYAAWLKEKGIVSHAGPKTKKAKRPAARK